MTNHMINPVLHVKSVYPSFHRSKKNKYIIIIIITFMLTCKFLGGSVLCSEIKAIHLSTLNWCVQCSLL